jgi:predicted ATPase
VRPLLDREAELAVLRSAVAAVAGGAGRSVVVVGAPGAGKTSLLDEARTLAERAGLRVLSARGDELEHEHPYGLVRQLFETALLGPGARAVAVRPGLGGLLGLLPRAPSRRRPSRR